MNVAEKDREKFHNKPETYEDTFTQLLPYAILFGMEKKWLNHLPLETVDWAGEVLADDISAW